MEFFWSRGYKKPRKHPENLKVPPFFPALEFLRMSAALAGKPARLDPILSSFPCSDRPVTLHWLNVHDYLDFVFMVHNKLFLCTIRSRKYLKVKYQQQL